MTRLTLFDTGGDNGTGSPVFTDTSAPLNCALDELKNTMACLNTPFKDMFSPFNAPPTPDSGSQLRVVFNKIPLKLNGLDLEPVPADSLPDESMLKLADQNVVMLTCDGQGCGVPESYNSLQVNGSDLTPDPTTFAYGPALQMQILPSYDAMNGAPIPSGLDTGIADDPLRALEPGTIYHVVLNPGLSGRNPTDKVQLDDSAKALLTFSTEVFRMLRVGIGDAAADTRIGDPCIKGTNTLNDPYIAASSDSSDMTCTYTDLANDGVIAVYLNASVDGSVIQTATAFATVSVDGGASNAVAVKLTSNVASDETDNSTCSRGNQRVLYIAPTSGTWVTGLADGSTAEVNVTLRGADIRDVSQLAGHPPGMGRHVLSGDVLLRGNIKSSNTRGMNVVSAAAVNVCS